MTGCGIFSRAHISMEEKADGSIRGYAANVCPVNPFRVAVEIRCAEWVELAAVRTSLIPIGRRDGNQS